MSDRELLELAAKAAGFVEIDFLAADHLANVYDAEGRQFTWNPLTDDGDHARLEAALNIDVEWHTIGVVAILNDKDLIHHTHRFREVYADHGGDKQKARRYAGVRAAAAIGKATP
jgi:hypothetical protein